MKCVASFCQVSPADAVSVKIVPKLGFMHLGRTKPVGESFSILLLCDTLTCQHVRLHHLTSSALIAKSVKGCE